MACIVDTEPIPALQINQDRLGVLFPYVKYNTKEQESKVELPLIVWKDKYLKNPKEYYNMLQKISDSLLLNNSTIFKKNNPNQTELYNRFLGKLSKKDYIDQDEVYGRPSFVPVKDNSFYHEVFEKLMSRVTAMPFVFNITNTSEDYLDKKLEDVSKKLSGLLRNAALDSLKQQGINTEGLEDKSVPEPLTKEQILSFLDGSEKFELVLWKLVKHVVNQNDFLEKVIKPSFRESFIVNTEFAHIDTSSDDISVEAISCKNVQFLSSKDQIQSLEDPSVIACGVSDYISLQEIVRTYGYTLDAMVGADKLKSVLNRMQRGDKSVEYYNPSFPLFGDETIATGELDMQDAGEIISKEEDYFGHNRRYFNEVFYPRYSIGSAITCKFLRHRFYFRILVNKKFKLLINGKNPTQSQIEEFKYRNLDNKLIADFISVPDNYKKSKGEHIVTIPREELHEATRLGHSTFVNCGKYRYGQDYIKNQNKPGFPIVMQSSYDKSFVKLGEHMEITINKLQRTVDELVNASGFSSAILIDDVQGYDPYDVIYSLKKVGMAVYNSQRLNNSGSAGRQMHLSQIATGSQLQDIEQHLQLIGLIKMSYEKICGVFNQSNPYDGLAETQINIAQRESIFGSRYQEHNNFIKQVLQRVSDIAKNYYSKYSRKIVDLGNGEVEILKKLDGMQNYEYNVFLNNGADLKNKAGQIDKMMEYISQSGGVDFIDSILEVLWEDNPIKKLDIFKNKKEMLLKAQAQASEANAAASQEQKQLEVMKAQIPLEREKLIIQRELAKIQEKARVQKEMTDAKGRMSDVKEQNDREKMLLNKELEAAFSESNPVTEKA